MQFNIKRYPQLPCHKISFTIASPIDLSLLGIMPEPVAKMRRWNAAQFRATLQAYFLPVSLLGAVGYFAKGLITHTVLVDFLIALPAAIPAIFLGRYLNHKLKNESFFKYVYIGLLLIGGLLILSVWK